VRLSKECQKRLETAERKVEVLIKGGDGAYRTEQFEESEE
jgi:exonuclease VII small subunit